MSAWPTRQDVQRLVRVPNLWLAHFQFQLICCSMRSSESFAKPLLAASSSLASTAARTRAALPPGILRPVAVALLCPVCQTLLRNLSTECHPSLPLWWAPGSSPALRAAWFWEFRKSHPWLGHDVRLVGLFLFSVILCLFHHAIDFSDWDSFPFCLWWFHWTRSGQTRSSSPLRRCWLPNLKHCSSTCCLHVMLPRVARTSPLSPPPRVARGDLRLCSPAVGIALSVMGPGVPTLAVFFMGSRVPIPGCFTFFRAVWLVFHTRFGLSFLRPGESLTISSSFVACVLVVLDGLLHDLIFRLALTLRSMRTASYVSGRWLFLSALSSSSIIVLSFNDDVMPTIFCLFLLRSSIGTTGESSIHLIITPHITALMLHTFPCPFPMLSWDFLITSRLAYIPGNEYASSVAVGVACESEGMSIHHLRPTACCEGLHGIQFHGAWTEGNHRGLQEQILVRHVAHHFGHWMYEVEDVLLQVEFRSSDCLGHLLSRALHSSFFQVSNDGVQDNMLGFERLD